MIEAKEIDGELWIKASDHHQSVKKAIEHEREAILAVIGDNQCECRCSEVVRDRGKA